MKTSRMWAIAASALAFALACAGPASAGMITQEFTYTDAAHPALDGYVDFTFNNSGPNSFGMFSLTGVSGQIGSASITGLVPACGSIQCLDPSSEYYFNNGVVPLMFGAASVPFDNAGWLVTSTAGDYNFYSAVLGQGLAPEWLFQAVGVGDPGPGDVIVGTVGPVTAHDVPEPPSWTLLLAGLIGTGMFMAWRRKKAVQSFSALAA